jgi:hypothetical protein
LRTDLSIALSVKALSQQIHILFILIVVGSLVFFIHSLFRLLMLIMKLRRNPQARQHRPHIPSVAGPDGFKPDVPIPVQLARDEEIGLYDEEGKEVEKDAEEGVKIPPPAYGLWRGSVRLDPNLLHWQRVQHETSSHPPSQHNSPHLERRPSPQGSPSLGSVLEEPLGAQVGQGPGDGVRRPPSYVSEDGVSYVVSALPPAPPSEIHPAFRIRL